ncbi:MAG: hypothetical protein MUF49_00505 [Oculatellaceae cyanobacterium Prado106]|nr:hypothetical protein [Oculatellaceae cyanobacterium Prado106]
MAFAQAWQNAPMLSFLLSGTYLNRSLYVVLFRAIGTCIDTVLCFNNG